MTKVLLIRHGQTEHSSRPQFRGRADLALSDAGVAQARATSKRISSTSAWKPSAVYSSPLRRCAVTAQIISAPFGLAVQLVDGLNDIDYGEWQGLTQNEVKTRWPEQFEAWSHAPHLANIPSGEMLRAVMARASGALRDILRRHPNETVVLVGHNSVNRTILLHALELHLSRYRCLRHDVCGISELDFLGGRFSIRRINETYHLESGTAAVVKVHGAPSTGVVLGRQRVDAPQGE